ncbi:MAG: hypothetical protein R3C44_09790 [Chloroflexota bacterium]
MDEMNVFQGIGVEVLLFTLRFAIPVLAVFGICRAYNGLCRKLGISEEEYPITVAE